MNVAVLVYPMKVLCKENKNWQMNCFFPMAQGTLFKVRMKFSKMFHTGSVLLQLMSALNPLLIEKKLIHMTLQRHKLYALFVAKPFPSPLYHKLCGKLNNSLLLFWWSRENGEVSTFVALHGEPKPHLSG